jgi:glycosyltransferase involved in cell wall biosynthesis
MDPCKRVLHIVREMDCGGAETLLMNIYRAMDRRHLQFDFAVATNHECAYDAEIAALGGRIWHLPDPTLSFLGYCHSLRRILHSEQYAAAHCHLYAFSGICLAIMKILGVPVRVCHSHTTSDGKMLSPIRKAYRRFMQYCILRCSTHLLCVSIPSGEALFGSDCWKDPRTRVVHNGIDLAPYENLPTRHDARKRLGLPDSGVLIGHIGRLAPPKNHGFILDIFLAIRNLGVDARLVLVGTGALKAELERQVHASGLTGLVSFLGLRADVPEILAALDLFLFPSLHEGLGIAVIEAQAAGLPIIASDAVPPEADLELGLLQRLPLKLGADAWARTAMAAFGVERMSWSSRREALLGHGYDVRILATYLTGVYCSGTSWQESQSGAKVAASL